MSYQPASVTTQSGPLNHLSTIWYDKVAVENLKSNLPYVAATARRRLPNREGRTIQLFSYDTLPANTTPGTEGVVGTGLTPSSVIRSATVQPYFDYMSFSSLLQETAIDPIVEAQAAEMGYRAALTANALSRTEFENFGSGADIDLADNEFLSAATVREAAMRLRSLDVRPPAGAMFMGIIHPFAAFDLTNDNTAGGVTDILKRSEAGIEELQRGIQGFRVLDLAGVRFIETNTVQTSADFPSSGKTGYHTHVVGMDAVFSVSLGATEIPDQRNFQLIVKQWEPSVADPAGVIGASVAYNFIYASLRAPGTVIRARRIRSETSIT